MKGYEGIEQIDIFNLDVLEKPSKKYRKEELQRRKEKNKKSLWHTLHISNILENKCRTCEFNSASNTDNNVCVGCDYYKELRKHSEGLMETTKDKIHKESWNAKDNVKNDDKLERLYYYQSIAELEKDFKKDYIESLREQYTLVEIANLLDCEYRVLKNYVSKYGLNKRKDGSYY